MRASGYLFFLSCFLIVLAFFSGGCAQVGIPTGGPKDTLAPKLIKATPAYGSRNVATNKFTLEFNEYIDVQDLQKNMIISPLQKKTPTVIINPRSISFKFRDTLRPNTTYTVNFGDAVRDINEGNVYKDLSYTFSTGNHLDSLTLSGTVILAETGGADSTMIVMLYRNTADSAVKKIKPDYIAKLNGDGSFNFTNLPPDPFKIYALKDVSGVKTYNSLSELFAFTDSTVTPGSTGSIILFAYAQQPAADNQKITPQKPVAEKKLRISTALQGRQDLLTPLEMNFNSPLKFIDSNKIYLTDTFYNKIPSAHLSSDSTAKKLFLTTAWKPETPLILFVEKDAVKDSAGNMLSKTDTVRFFTKKNEDYGKLTLRFNGLDLKKKPVMQFLSGDVIMFSYPLSSPEWVNNMFPPAEYGIRILYDSNGDGKWTPGNYAKKLQPEISITLRQKLSVRADWDNEREIDL